jgi:predicted AAA+ superfamily ATPase
MADAEFAADLAQVLRGNAPAQYADPGLFFSNTYPTRGLKDLLLNVCGRLSSGQGVASIFRLDTSYGGGKTHGLIALVHAVRSGRTISNIGEFVDPTLLPTGNVRIAAYDGENADPSNGRKMECGVLAYTPWGELAAQLAGSAGYERIRRSDESRTAPGSETLQELFGGEPTLILLDELSVYLRKVQSMPAARDQLTAFLTALFKAVESTPNAVLVYTLAVGRDGKAQDAYTQENQFLAEKMAEAESVSARKATLLNPTEDDETVLVLRRRLFESIDENLAAQAVDAYRALWSSQRDSIPGEVMKPEIVESFRRSYPFHPEVLDTLTGKTATLANFQRVRGMLRLLARTVGHLWDTQPSDATAIHVHHIDPGFGPIHQEFVTRLNLQIYNPAIRNDISGEGNRTALAQEIDSSFYRGLPPYATYVARTVFLHSLGFPSQIQGIAPDHLRYSILAPSLDIGFIEGARKRFQERSAYLDDKPGAPLRFLTDANLTQIVERQIQLCDPGEVRSELSSRIRFLYLQGEFQLIPFPAAPVDVPDEIGSGKPLLALMSYDSVSVGTAVDAVPELIARIHKNVGSDGAGFRKLRNNLIFVVAEEAKINEMRREMARYPG